MSRFRHTASSLVRQSDVTDPAEPLPPNLRSVAPTCARCADNSERSELIVLSQELDLAQQTEEIATSVSKRRCPASTCSGPKQETAVRYVHSAHRRKLATSVYLRKSDASAR